MAEVVKQSQPDRSSRNQLYRRLALASTLLGVLAAVIAAASPTAYGGGRATSSKAATASVLAQAARRPACARVVSRHGSDRHSGTRRHPFRTVQRLVDSLRPGQTGCLLGGVFHGSVRFNHGGRPGAPISLTTWPHRHSTIAGRMYIPHGSDHINVVFLHLNGRNRAELPSPTVDGADIVFAFDNVTNYHTGICFDLGSLQYGEAVYVMIARTRIHGCGTLPPTNHQHGVYDEFTYGAVIAYNLIYDNADRGIQLYPAAYGSRIYGNVIDGNGSGVLFAGDGSHASSGNIVADNIITFSQVSNIDSSWEGPRGSGNVVTHNCIWGARHYLIDAGAGGFAAYGNIFAKPLFAHHRRGSEGNFRLLRRSRCRPL